MRRIIFERGVPISLRSDNAPELMKGVVHKICVYFNIQQIVTGGHNPRGNVICERANQTVGNMIRKLTDKEYSSLKTHAIPAFQFAMNTTYHSSIGCSPFEAGYGLPAQTICQKDDRTREITRLASAWYGNSLINCTLPMYWYR